MRVSGRSLGRHLAALALVGVAGIMAGLWPGLGGGNLAMLFLVSVLVSAVTLGLGPALLAALAAAVAYNFFFLDPRLTFRIGHAADLLTFSVFFAVALATGWLAGRVKDQARGAIEQARMIGALLEASRRLSASAAPEAAGQVIAEHLAAASGGAAVVLVPDGPTMRILGGPGGLDQLSPASMAAARHAWEADEITAPAEDEAGWRFLPLRGLHGQVGVAGLRRTDLASGGEANRMISALLEQGAVALERVQLASAAAENDALRRADQLRSALLSSISHDFRTPLSSVLGSATTLLDFERELKPTVRRDLLRNIAEEARRLNRYVGDLLDMSRLEGGALKPRQQWTDVREAINSAAARLEERLGERRVERDFAPQLSKVRLDPTLLEQAVLNILENAASYSPDGSRIGIAAHEDLKHVLISIEDEGPGVPPEAMDQIFDKFRRLEQPSDRGKGLGLGLSIAKGFIEAMGGRILAVSPAAAGRGTRFLISLPKSVATPRDLL